MLDIVTKNKTLDNYIENKMDGGLVREDGAYLYRIEDGIPIMLIDEAIALDPST